MVFPGVLRGRPGPRLATTPTSRPRRSLSSPGMYCASSVPPANKKRRGPKPLRGTRWVRPGGLSLRVARPHTSVASLFAARFRVWIESSWRADRVQPPWTFDPAPSAKMSSRADAHARTRARHGAAADALPTHTRAHKAVRKGLEVLPQWMYG